MRTARIITLVALLGVLPALCQNQAPKKVESRTWNSAVFNASFEQVWSALMEALTTANIQPGSMDKASGTVFFQTESAWAHTWGGVNNAVVRFTTKEVRQFSTWQGFAVKGTLYCKRRSDLQTEVILTFNFVGYNGWSGLWETLYSNGTLEGSILDGIESRLPALPERGLLPPKDKQAVLEAGQKLLGLLRRVDAAFKVEPRSSAALEVLIDAQAFFDEIEDQPRMQGIAAGLDAARDALAVFKESRRAEVVGSGRLQSARELINTLARVITEFQSEKAAVLPADGLQVSAPSVSDRKGPVVIDHERRIIFYDAVTDEEVLEVEILAVQKSRVVVASDGITKFSGELEAGHVHEARGVRVIGVSLQSGEVVVYLQKEPLHGFDFRVGYQLRIVAFPKRKTGG